MVQRKWLIWLVKVKKWHRVLTTYAKLLYILYMEDQAAEAIRIAREQKQKENDDIVMENINKITRQDPANLNTTDRDYLCARFSYLSADQKKTFGGVYKQKQKEVEEAQNSEDTN